MFLLLFTINFVVLCFRVSPPPKMPFSFFFPPLLFPVDSFSFLSSVYFSFSFPFDTRYYEIESSFIPIFSPKVRKKNHE